MNAGCSAYRKIGQMSMPSSVKVSFLAGLHNQLSGLKVLAQVVNVIGQYLSCRQVNGGQLGMVVERQHCRLYN